MEICVGKLVRIIQTGRGCCIVHTQHNFCTQQLRYVGITILVILFWLSCVLKVWTNSFQEVLEAVLFGAWSIPPTAHGWLLCGSPTRVSMAFILSVGKIVENSSSRFFQISCSQGILNSSRLSCYLLLRLLVYMYLSQLMRTLTNYLKCIVLSF